METDFGIIELRRYSMEPGRRDEFIGLFEREFIESQETCGMTPIGHYRDLEDPNGFVWFRGFENMESRRRALEAFYMRCPAWLEHRAVANAALTSFDNVLLLRPARPGSGFDLRGLRRFHSLPATASSFVGVAVYMLSEPAFTDFIRAFETEMIPKLQPHGRRIAYFVTEDSPNDFPRLPVRENEPAFVVAGACQGRDGLGEWIDAARTAHWNARRGSEIISSEYLRLEPAARAIYR